MTAREECSNKTVPITSIADIKKEVRAFSASEVANIRQVVNNALTSFLSGNKETIAKGMGTLLGDAFTAFLSEGDASSDVIEMCYVATDGLSPVRIDVKSWYQVVTAKFIATKIERIITVVAIKSIIDVNKFDQSKFLDLYQRRFEASKMSQEELSKAINDAADIYQKFVESSQRQGTLS